MKLKKIASLALAGVMAVSMLAGCSTENGSSSTPDQGETEVVPTSEIVNLFNSKQANTNAVKINFTGDAQMEKDLQKAVELNAAGGSGYTSAYYLQSVYNGIAGLTTSPSTSNSVSAAYDEAAGMATAYYTNAAALYTNMGLYNYTYRNPTAASSPYAIADGSTHTFTLLVSVKETATIRSLEAAVNSVMPYINPYVLALLEKDSFGPYSKTPNTDYYAYSYTGNVCAVTGTNTDGTTTHYIAMSITQTASAETTPSV